MDARSPSPPNRDVPRIAVWRLAALAASASASAAFAASASDTPIAVGSLGSQAHGAPALGSSRPGAGIDAVA